MRADHTHGLSSAWEIMCGSSWSQSHMPALEEGSGTASGERSTPEEEPKSLKDPISAVSPLPRTHLPSPWLRMQKYKMHGASWHHCKGHHLLISITVSWTSYDTRAWAGKWVAGSTAGQLSIAQPLKTMLCSPRQAKASGPGSPVLLVTQSKSGRLLAPREAQGISQEVSSCLF